MTPTTHLRGVRTLCWGDSRLAGRRTRAASVHDAAPPDRFGVVGADSGRNPERRRPRLRVRLATDDDSDIQVLALDEAKTLSDTWSLRGERCAPSLRGARRRRRGQLQQCGFTLVVSSFPCLRRMTVSPLPAPAGQEAPAFRGSSSLIFDPQDEPVSVLPTTARGVWTEDGKPEASFSDGSAPGEQQCTLARHLQPFIAGAARSQPGRFVGREGAFGFIYPSLFVGDNDAIPGSGQIIHTLGNIGLARVQVRSTTTYYGVYATDTIDVTPALAATLGARFNGARVELEDQLGTSPELNGTHTFHRLNPNAGVAYKLSDDHDIHGLFGSESRTDAARARLQQWRETVPPRRLPCRRSIAAASRLQDLRAGHARTLQLCGRTNRVAGVRFPHQRRQRHRQCRQRDPGPRVFPERSRDAPAGRRHRAHISQRAVARVPELQLHRRDISIHRRPAVAKQSPGRRERQHPRHSRQSHSRDSAQAGARPAPTIA